MGSGGPRGLQILLSVADRGRGGFDSHTFPPLFGALVLAVALAAAAPGPARADMPPIRPDSTGAVPDTSALHPAARPPATPGTPAAPGERRRPWHATPFAIMARSAVVPGWGQAANHRWLKAAVVAGGEGYLGARFLSAWSDFRAADRRLVAAFRSGNAAAAQAAQLDLDRAFTRRANAGWMLAVAAALSMMDAYVDAHFLQFDADFGPDPELPDEVTGPSSLRTPAPGVRLGVRVARF